MFSLGNFDLDIEDDFSSNIFASAFNSETRKETEKVDVLGGIKFRNEDASESSSRDKQFLDQTNRGSRISSNDVCQLMEEPRKNILKRPHMQCEKPQKKRLSNEGLLQRKFPGPAGLLPDKPFREITDTSLPMEKPRDEKEDLEKPVVYSQRSGSVFEESSYQKLLSDFNLNEPDHPLKRYTVEWLKKTALSKGLQGKKIPFLGLVVHSVNHTMPDPVVVLRDPTGEIYGSLHREVWTDMGPKLKAGIALALRQVGVLITGVIRRQIYLNITMNNILALYSPSENEGQVEITTVNKMCKSDLVKSFEQWLPQPSVESTAKQPPDLLLFATVNNMHPPLLRREEKAEGSRGRKTEEVLANLGIDLTECDFNEDMPVTGAETTPVRRVVPEDGENVVRGRNSGSALSQAESLIFEEVLSGIDLDEFET